MELKNQADNIFYNNKKFKMNSALHNLIMQIKNGKKSGLKMIQINGNLSNICIDILNILQNEGYIEKFKQNTKKNIIITTIYLKYKQNGQSNITSITKISKPSCLIFSTSSLLWQIKSGLGLFIVSTSKGILTCNDARLLNVGGKVLYSIV